MNQESFKCLHTMCKNNQGEHFLCISCHSCVQLPCAEHVHVRQASVHTSPVHFPLHVQIHILYSPSLQQGRISQNQQSHFSGSVYYTGQKHQTGFVNKLYRSTCTSKHWLLRLQTLMVDWQIWTKTCHTVSCSWPNGKIFVFIQQPKIHTCFWEYIVTLEKSQQKKTLELK